MSPSLQLKLNLRGQSRFVDEDVNVNDAQLTARYSVLLGVSKAF